MARDRTAFEMFFQEEYPAVVRSLCLVTGDRAAAEDAAQEAFARLYVHFPRIARYERPHAWVRRVAINLAISQRRRKQPWVPPGGAGGPSADRADIVRALGALPRMQRAAIVLHYFEDRPADEIGQILNCSASTVRVHLHRARAKLAAALGEEAIDADR